MYYFNDEKNHIEYQIEPIPESGYPVINTERGSMMCRIYQTQFFKNDYDVLYQNSYIRRLYFDNNKNIYKTKTAKNPWFII